MKIDPEQVYRQIGQLIATVPDFGKVVGAAKTPAEVTLWLGRAYAQVEATGDIVDSVAMRQQIAQIRSERFGRNTVDTIMTILYRALAKAELSAPAASHGAFLPAGSAFDALMQVGKVLGGAKKDVLIIDPYMDEKVLTEFALTMPEGVSLRLIADKSDVKASLKPAAERWCQQYEAKRALKVSLAAPRSLHDRLIIVDGVDVWVLTQSFNGLASRSPASIVKVDSETAALKIVAYQTVWDGAEPII